jgi:hypothetical protein
MGIHNILSAGVMGAFIGLVVGFCFPKMAGHVFGAFTDPF